MVVGGPYRHSRRRNRGLETKVRWGTVGGIKKVTLERFHIYTISGMGRILGFTQVIEGLLQV